MSTNAAIEVPELFVFDGQGTPASSLHVINLALSDAATPLGTALLSAIHAAFLSELSSLDEAELAQLDVRAADFPTPKDLVEIPSAFVYEKQGWVNPLISNAHLAVVQHLRYLANYPVATDPNHKFNFAGFSSGILPATAAAASDSLPSFLYYAVQAFRLAFWIGVRSQIFRHATLNDAPRTSEGEFASSPWSLVVFGLGREDVQDAIERFDTLNVCRSILRHRHKHP